MPDLSFRDRFKHAWNAFRGQDNLDRLPTLGPSYSVRPDRVRLRWGTERSIINSVYTRLGLDVAAIPIKHVRLDQNGRYAETIESGLNRCLTLEANLDQNSRSFLQDVVMSMCDEGSVAIVPVDTSINPIVSGSYDILTMRTAKIIEWFPEYVRVRLYNQDRGQDEEITLPKKMLAIIENPLYSVMNERNSTMQRLIHKLNLLDVIDEQSGSGKLDLILQMPYVVKTERKQQQAESRRQAVEDQLKDSKYGIAYVDATEKITQLNRPAENNLMTQIEYLTSMLYSQLGLTQAIFDGTAKEEELLNYFNRTIEPIISNIALSMKRSFITKTGMTQGQSIEHMRNPFMFVTASQFAELSDKFSRNEILSANEIRGVIGFQPSSQAGADKLQNKNIAQAPPTQNNQNERKINEG